MSVIAETFSGPDISVCSFDMFDTLFYRRSGMPETVFDLMKEEWGERFGCAAPECFASLRAGSERQAQQRHGRDTVTIDEIYESMCVFLGPTDPSIEEIIDYELDMEKRVLAPVAAGAELVDKARHSGKQIVFPSDTYLPESFLTELLQRHGFMQKGDRLYASAKRGASKATGQLFPHVAKDLGLPASSLLHIGNSEEVDVKRARSNGWRAQHFGLADWNNREWVLWHLSQAGRGLSQHVHAAARNARLNGVGDDRQDNAAFNIGAAVAGPVLVAFAEWILEQARKDGIDELFFLSRDAQVVFEICRIISENEKNAQSPKLTYVYGSRQVWAFYALRSLVENDQAAFFADQLAFSATSLEDCADLLGFAGDAAVRNLFPRIQKVQDAAPDREQRLRFYQSLLDDHALRNSLQSKMAERSRIYMEYLSTLPVRAGSSCAIVDIGWSGMWTEIVGSMFRDAGAGKVVGLQMGRFRKTHPTWNVRVECFLFDESPSGAAPGWIVPLLEVFCGADHGRVIGMKKATNDVVAVESSRRFGGMPEGAFRSFRSGILSFARESLAIAKAAATPIGDCSALTELLKRFWLFPTEAEARFVAHADVGLSPNADQDRIMLRPYRAADLARLLATSRLPGFEPHWWHRGALAITQISLAAAIGIIDSLYLSLKLCLRGASAQSTAIPINNIREHAKFLRWLLLPKNI